MARLVTIRYKKITFSLPAKIVEVLKGRVVKNKRSEFVAAAIREKVNREEEFFDVKKFFKNFRNNAVGVSDRNSLDIIRSKRYEDK